VRRKIERVFLERVPDDDADDEEASA
jgi:hypothetical protein